MITDADGTRVYEINTAAKFAPPLEVRWQPVRPLRVKEPARIELYAIGGNMNNGRFPGYDIAASSEAEIRGVRGDVPGMTTTSLPTVTPGESFSSRSLGRSKRVVLSGTPTKAGVYELEVEAAASPESTEKKVISVRIPVLDKNIAPNANKVIARVTRPTGAGAKDLQMLRDGMRYDQSYSSNDGEPNTERDWYGYEWDTPQQIAQLIYTTGEGKDDDDDDDSRAWESFDVEYRNDDGEWTPVDDLRVAPNILVRWRWSFRPHSITFTPVETTAIRIIGKPGDDESSTSIAELEVYGSAVDLPEAVMSED
jgi:hypothetical protein